jgi:hypothetical protein
MTREGPHPDSRRIDVAEEEAKHHFAPDGDQKSPEKDQKTGTQKATESDQVGPHRGRCLARRRLFWFSLLAVCEHARIR